MSPAAESRDGNAGPRSRRTRLPLVALAAVAVLAAVVAVVAGTRLASARADDSRRTAILAAARQSVVDFTTLDYRTVDRDVARVTDGAAGAFKRDFTAKAADLRKLVTENRTVSKGQVLDAGIVTADADSARVLVVADSDVTNAAAPKGSRRHFRLQLDLVRQSGRWLTSDLQFVG